MLVLDHSYCHTPLQHHFLSRRLGPATLLDPFLWAACSSASALHFTQSTCTVPQNCGASQLGFGNGVLHVNKSACPNPLSSTRCTAQRSREPSLVHYQSVLLKTNVPHKPYWIAAWGLELCPADVGIRRHSSATVSRAYQSMIGSMWSSPALACYDYCGAEPL